MFTKAVDVRYPSNVKSTFNVLFKPVSFTFEEKVANEECENFDGKFIETPKL
jgi:hypothetical protein